MEYCDQENLLQKVVFNLGTFKIQSGKAFPNFPKFHLSGVICDSNN